MSGLPIIIIALTGKTVNLYNISTSQSIKSLRKILELATNISIHRQVLLNPLGAVLDDSNPVIAYADQKVYLFDKALFLTNNTINAKEFSGLEQIMEFEELSVEKVSFPDHLLHVGEEELRSEYEKMFFIQMEQMEVVLKCAKARNKFCEQSLEEQRNQLESVKAALKNLDGHCVNCQRNLNEFLHEYKKDEERFQYYIQNFEKSLSHLGEIPLHNAISNEKRSLRDCIPEGPLREWLLRSQKELKLFSERVSSGEIIANQIQKQVNKQKLDLFPLDNLSNLQNHEKKSVELLKKISHSMNHLQRDYGAYYQTFHSKEPLDKAMQAKLNRIVNTRDEIYERSKHNLQELYEICQECSKSKIAISETLVRKLKEVAVVEAQIKKLNHKIIAFQSVLKSIRQKFRQVELIYHFPASYSLSMLELIRRREFLIRYESEISRMKSKLRTIRDEEIEKEKLFIHHVARYIPPKLIPSLHEYVPSCKIEMEEMQQALPSIAKTSFKLNDAEMKEIRVTFQSKLGELNLQEYLNLLHHSDNVDEGLLFAEDSETSSQHDVSTTSQDLYTIQRYKEEVQHLEEKVRLQEQQLQQKDKDMEKLKMSNSVNEKIRVQCTLENNQIKRQIFEMKEKLRDILDHSEEKSLSDLKGQLLQLLN